MDDIERMAREAGAGFDDTFESVRSNPMWLMTPVELQRFAELVRAAERERWQAQIEKCRGALADIANSSDMTLKLAQAKARRIYAETGDAIRGA